ncbi:DoxX family protein [Nocardiopsis changdeensis]|uniref:DoxX family protein n=1 Tax=Nocardiopsis changdeensis TaxID=2831969 RepID=A0ABX8BFZ7_9ACTN|nr:MULTISPECIES: DoxX family protein [Nocardiopsis]QUX21167.1 DoxX family protein [Nocardiopsis changdeensis]QYX37097.1 DoxX family protein [Nocardiopsis sp. MT53]
MSFLHLAAVLPAALLCAAAAVANLTGHRYPREEADRLGVPRTWIPVLGTLLGAGALGLLAGLAVPAVGLAAAAGLVLYFVGALVAHLRVGDLRLGAWALFSVLSAAALAAYLLL